MGNKLIVVKNLELLLQTKWAEFIDRTTFMRIVLEHARDTEYRIVYQYEIPPPSIKLSITKFAIDGSAFEVWVEFTVPKNEGVVVGTHVFSLTLSGELDLKNTHGTHFVPKNSDNV